MYERSRLIAPRNIVNTRQIYTFYILKELSLGKTVFGNQILEVFKEEFLDSSMPFPVSSSTVYETLYSLEENGYVISKWSGDQFINKRNKKIYSITDEGKRYYLTHIADYVDSLNRTKSTLDKLIKLLK